MGASNSKPQTVQMANPIQITRDVAERINQATAKNTKLGANLCETCKQRGGTGALHDMASTPQHRATEVQPVNVAKSWKKRSSEAEESQFNQSVNRVRELFGHPKKWSKECSSDIKSLEVEVINCYQRYPNETLQCSDLAKQYNRFVFGRQIDEVMKTESDEFKAFV